MNSKTTVEERTLNYLAPLLSDTFRAIELGNACALVQFESDGEKLSLPRLLDTMRYKTHIYLSEKGYELEDLPMYGIHIKHNGYEIKVLKVQNNGQPPICGKSYKRWKFYNHQFNPKLPYFDEFQEIIKEFELENRRELLILYKVGRDGNFLGLELACTEKADHNFAAPLLAWNIPVPHYANFASNPNTFEEPLKEIRTFEEDEDQELDIFQDGTNN